MIFKELFLNKYNINLIMSKTIKEYFELQEKYSTKYGEKTILLFQLGDFFEFYGTETEGCDVKYITSNILHINMMKIKYVDQSISKNNPFKAGFPVNSKDKFIDYLLEENYTVVVYEQEYRENKDDDVVRYISGILSPGTHMDYTIHNKSCSNSIVSLYIEQELQKKTGKYLFCCGMVGISVSTGKINYLEAYSKPTDEYHALDEAIRFINAMNPSEVLINYTKKENGMDEIELENYLELENRVVRFNKKIDKQYFNINYQTNFLKKIYPDEKNTIEYLGIEKNIYVIPSMLILLEYMYDHNKNIIAKLSKPELYFQNNLLLANNAIYQLKIFSKSKEKCLFYYVDNTSTILGRRLLQSNLSSPMINVEQLNLIYDSVEELKTDDLYKEFEKHLNNIVDIEKISRKLEIGLISPIELANLYNSYKNCMEVWELVKETERLYELINIKTLKKINDFFQEFDNTFDIEKLEKYNSINDIETNIFKEEIYKEIDELENIVVENENFIDNLCSTLSKIIRSGVTENLVSVKQTEKKGSYVNITKIRMDNLKEKLDKRETLKVGSRELDVSKFVYTNNGKNGKIVIPFLDEISTDTKNNLEKIQKLCKKYFLDKIKEFDNEFSFTFKKVNRLISYSDYIKSSAKTSIKYNYVKPTIKENKTSFIEAKNLRNAIIERNIEHEYIPIDININDDCRQIILYGVNGAGKSSLMNKVGLSIVMAQAGLYVPASEFIYYPYHKLFPRNGGKDNIIKGISTFEDEMIQLRSIFSNSDKHSLILCDELASSTETDSALAIVAASIVLLNKKNSSLILSTHLHQLTKIEEIKNLKKIRICHITTEIDEENDRIIYNRKLEEGQGSESYGLLVSKYILKNSSFTDLCLKIKNDITKDKGLLPYKKSKYNAKVLIHQCQICGEKDIEGMISTLQTHHINHQEDCNENGFVTEKPHIKKNDLQNLAVLCVKCHNKHHNGELEIDGYVMTSNGKALQTNNKSNNKSN